MGVRMSTSVTREKPVAGPSRGLGVAAAGLAIVVAIGIGFTLSEDNAAPPSDVQPAQPQVSDSRRVKVEMIAERDAVSPGADVEVNEASHPDSEERRGRIAKTHGHKTGKGKVAGS
jgi:hypothetical protein